MKRAKGKQSINRTVFVTTLTVLSALFILLFSWLDLVYAGEHGKLITNSTKNPARSWLIKKGDLYSPQNFPPTLAKLLHVHKPNPIVENKKTVNWIPERAYVLPVQDVTFYSVSYRPEPDIDVESTGLLLIATKQSEVLYQEASNTVAPAYTVDPVPALSVVRNKNRDFVFLRSFEDLSQKSFLRIISPFGEIIDGLVTPGRGEFRTDDLDGDGGLEIFGYGIAKNTGLVTHQNVAGEKDLSTRKIPTPRRGIFFASLGGGAIGKFQIFTLTDAGALIPLAGGVSKKFYEDEAISLLPYIKKLAQQKDKQKLTDAVVAYLGVIEGTRDPNLTLELYKQLPSDVRALMDSVAIAKYWKEQGYPFLTQVFK